MQREPHVGKPASRAPAPDSYVPRVRPFHIRVDEDVLDDLEHRLGRARWTRVGVEPGWKRGTDPHFLRTLVAYWRVGFDWRRQETKLGELPQYIARIHGHDVHFVHLRARTMGAIPLLLLHGWPDSFYRYHRLAPLLADAGYDVIIPSLPGFAFTRALPSVEQPMRATALLMHELMTDVLGYTHYGVVGGDGGSVIAQSLAIDFQEYVVGIHLTDLGWHAVKREPDSELTWRERRYIARNTKEFLADGAYVMVQSTRPRSLAVSLNDSPVGLASWIVDRFHSWSNGDLDARFGKDVLLTNIMLYWITQSIGSSIFTYYAEAQSPSLTVDDFVDVPVAVAAFPDDIGGIPPKRLAQRTLALTRWTEMPRGGHFAALEEPALYARDVLAFFRSLEHT